MNAIAFEHSYCRCIYHRPESMRRRIAQSPDHWNFSEIGNRVIHRIGDAIRHLNDLGGRLIVPSTPKLAAVTVKSPWPVDQADCN